MNRGLHLILAALVVVSFGVGVSLAFTPAISPIPDIVIGDRTPGNTSAGNDQPSDPFTHGDSLEGIGAQPEDVFDFPNAVNIFSLVQDQPALPGFTSDENLIYTFIESPVAPATSLAPGEQRISINGTAISTAAYTTVTVNASGELSLKDRAMSVDAFATTLSSQGSFEYNWINPVSHASNAIATGDSTPSGAVTLVDQVAMTIRVSNLTGGSASRDFNVFTVNNGADSANGLIVGGPTPQDLSGWTYLPAATGAGVYGPTYPGDTQATGNKVADNDSDSSVQDLRLTTGDTNGDFDHWFYSPANTIPFVQDATYHLAWNVGTNIGTAIAVPNVRLRWAYNVFGTLGDGSQLVATNVATPAAGGTVYQQMFDQLPNISSATATVVGEPENTVKLFFETYEFDPGSPNGAGNVGGGQVELNDVEITRLDRPTLLGLMANEATIADYTNTSLLPATGNNFSGSAGPFVSGRTATQLTITTPGAPVASTIGHPYGQTDGNTNSTNLSLIDEGVGFPPFVPSSSTGLAYRMSIRVDSTANSTTTQLPRTNIQFASFNAGNGQLYTSSIDVNAVVSGGGATNPAYDGVNTYAAYLLTPAGVNLDGGTIGSKIGGGIHLQDLGPEGGAIIVDQMVIQSFPENVLP